MYLVLEISLKTEMVWNYACYLGEAIMQIRGASDMSLPL